jgi:hypothetical protein
MSIASQIDPALAARQAQADARTAARAERDLFIQAQFALLGAQFDAMLRTALGQHSRIALTVTPLTFAVQGRSFASLTVDTWQVRCSLNALPQTVSFAPRLDFREADQFGVVECTLDFPYLPQRSRADATARALLERGVQWRGKTSATPLLQRATGPATGLAVLAVADLEDAFRVWWLRS